MHRVSSSSLLVLLIVQSFFSDSLSLPVSFMDVNEESNAFHGSEVNTPAPSPRVECPAGTLNEGWSFEGQSAFKECREVTITAIDTDMTTRSSQSPRNIAFTIMIV